MKAGIPLYVSFGELERRAAAAAYTLAGLRVNLAALSLPAKSEKGGAA